MVRRRPRGARRQARRGASRGDRAPRRPPASRRAPERVVLDVHGVGYERAACRSRRSSTLPDEGKTVSAAHPHARARGRARSCSASVTETERALFRLLIAHQRRRAALALTILSGLPAQRPRRGAARGRSRAPPRHSRRRQEDRRAHGGRAAREGARARRGAAARAAAPRRDADGRGASRALTNLGYPRPQAERAVRARSSAPRGREPRGADQGGAAGSPRDETLRRATSSTGERGDERQLDCAAPRTLDEFVGQDALRENLRVFIRAARERGEPLDHMLFYGPPGPRQDHARARDRARDGRAAARHRRPGDRARRAISRRSLTNLEPGAVLFIDEIHRLAPRRRGDPLSGDGGLQARPR